MTEPETVSHFPQFLPASFDDHCEYCNRRLKFGECEFCDAA